MEEISEEIPEMSPEDQQQMDQEQPPVSNQPAIKRKPNVPGTGEAY
jgi:hypothetical protein